MNKISKVFAAFALSVGVSGQALAEGGVLGGLLGGLTGENGLVGSNVSDPRDNPDVQREVDYLGRDSRAETDYLSRDSRAETDYLGRDAQRESDYYDRSDR